MRVPTGEGGGRTRLAAFAVTYGKKIPFARGSSDIRKKESQKRPLLPLDPKEVYPRIPIISEENQEIIKIWDEERRSL